MTLAATLGVRRVEHVVRAGFMPLVDAAPLIAAARLGFAEKEGITIALERETSWAAVRDRVAVSHLDVAHMLAPMPLAANLGLVWRLAIADQRLSKLSVGNCEMNATRSI